MFAAVALAPAGLLALGVLGAPVWLLVALVYMSVLVVVMDQIVALYGGDAAEGAEFPGSDGLLVAIGVVQMVSMPVAVVVLTGPALGSLGLGWKVAGFLALGFWLGQVAVPAAHELIHRPQRGLFRLGVAMYVAILFGHHSSAHRLVHHRHAATPLDPNTARAGESYYRFARRAWWGSFREGLAAETARRAARRQDRAGWRGGADRRGGGLHPYAVYCGGAALVLLLAHALGGWSGVAVWLALSAHATSQLLLSDYVQHYGLQRRIGANGKPEPMGLAHSWNAPFWFSSALMLNAPRHSDHHSHPDRPYPALRMPGQDEAPHLPWPLPVACMIALWPRRWRRLMRAPLRHWQNSAGSLAE